VVDFVPRTNFPDFRNRAIIITKSSTRMLIPREGGKVRVYVQVDDILKRNPGSSVKDIDYPSIMEV
jgi:phenol 2-monooxygenase